LSAHNEAGRNFGENEVECIIGLCYQRKYNPVVYGLTKEFAAKKKKKKKDTVAWGLVDPGESEHYWE
jgi:hypothetical protein